MRIGIIAHLKHRIGEPFAGGLETHTHLLASGLRRRGHDVVVFASDGSDPAMGVEPICQETSIREVGVAEATDVAFFREHHAYLKLLMGLGERGFDVIHNNSLHYLPVAMADAIATPMLTTLHTPPFCWLESGIRICRSSSSIFVAVSETLRQLWTPIAPVKEVVLNGIDLKRFVFRPQPASERYLAWSGRIVPEKGLHHAIDAARLLGMSLHIAGPVANPDYFEREIRPRLDERAVYLGHLSHSELADVIGGSRALLFSPCWEEPYGLVAAEALACGAPVAAFARGAVAEVLDEGCGVLAAPDDPAALARAAVEAQRLDRRNCRLRAERCCDADLMVSAYERLYAQMTLCRSPVTALDGELAVAI